MRLFSSLLVSTALFSLTAPAYAQDDVILVTAARVPVLAQDSTTSVTQLDAADLAARGPLFVADTHVHPQPTPEQIAHIDDQCALDRSRGDPFA